MVGPLLRFLQQLQRERAWLQKQRQIRWLAAPTVTPTVQRSQEQIIPLFGSGKGFGLDYVQTRSIPAPVQGRIIPENHPIVNRGGSIANLPPATTSARPYEDPSLSRSFRRTSETTDQKPIHTRRGGGVVANPIFSQKKNAGFEASRAPRTMTAADEHAKQLKAEPYWFIA